MGGEDDPRGKPVVYGSGGAGPRARKTERLGGRGTTAPARNLNRSAMDPTARPAATKPVAGPRRGRVKAPAPRPLRLEGRSREGDSDRDSDEGLPVSGGPVAWADISDSDSDLSDSDSDGPAARADEGGTGPAAGGPVSWADMVSDSDSDEGLPPSESGSWTAACGPCEGAPSFAAIMRLQAEAGAEGQIAWAPPGPGIFPGTPVPHFYTTDGAGRPPPDNHDGLPKSARAVYDDPISSKLLCPFCVGYHNVEVRASGGGRVKPQVVRAFCGSCIVALSRTPAYACACGKPRHLDPLARPSGKVCSTCRKQQTAPSGHGRRDRARAPQGRKGRGRRR